MVELSTHVERAQASTGREEQMRWSSEFEAPRRHIIRCGLHTGGDVARVDDAEACLACHRDRPSVEPVVQTVPCARVMGLVKVLLVIRFPDLVIRSGGGAPGDPVRLRRIW